MRGFRSCEFRLNRACGERSLHITMMVPSYPPHIVMVRATWPKVPISLVITMNVRANLVSPSTLKTSVRFARSTHSIVKMASKNRVQRALRQVFQPRVSCCGFCHIVFLWRPQFQDVRLGKGSKPQINPNPVYPKPTQKHKGPATHFRNPDGPISPIRPKPCTLKPKP